MDQFDETQSLRYLKWFDLYTHEKPYQIFMNIPRGRCQIAETNIEFDEAEPELIRNVRGNTDQFNLDDHGFAMRTHKTTVTSFNSADTIEALYLPEVEAMLKNEIEGVDQVFFFDWRLRKGMKLDTADMNDKMQYLPPFPVVHNDISESGALSRVYENTGAEAERLLEGRVRIVNTWRPIGNPVEDWPLCVCDGSTVVEKDLIECDHVRKDRQSSNHFPLPNVGYKWYYLHKQTPEEVIFIKTFDSKTDVRSKICPHTSFQHKSIRPNAPSRESIEVRALLFTFPLGYKAPTN